MPLPRSLLSRDPMQDLDLELVSGTWPDDLGGEVFIATSGLATAPAHAFFGDGLLARLSLRPDTFGAAGGRFAWRVRPIDTPSARLRAKRPAVFTGGPIGTNSPFGFSNAANTAPLPWGDRLFATWDAGRPVEVDPVTMGFLGEVGHRGDWNPAFDHPVLPLIPSAAHPMIDPDRDCMWTVSLNPMLGTVEIVRYDGTGTHVRRWPVRDGAVPQSMHTIAQTRDWLILIDCAFRADPAEILGGAERSVTNFTDEPVYLVRKDAVEATPSGEPVDARAFRVGPEVMHYYAVYDDTDGIRVIFEHTADTDLAYSMRAGDTDALGRPADPALAGMYNHPMHASVLTVVDFDPETGSVSERASFCEADRFWGAQLSAIDWSTEGMSSPTVHHMLYSGYRPEVISQRAIGAYAERIEAAGGLPGDEMPSALATFERDSLKAVSDHVYPLDDYPTSPCFVPRDPAAAGTSRYAGSDPGGHDGYVVVPVSNDGGFRVEVFDAADVGTGPLATLAAPDGRTVPFLLHSAWMPRAVTAPDVERLRFADELDERVGSLDTDLQHAVHEVAAELG